MIYGHIRVLLQRFSSKSLLVYYKQYIFREAITPSKVAVFIEVNFQETKMLS